MSQLEDQLIKHEGYRQFPYRDTVGKLTIGIGRNLDDVGITDDEAKYLLRSDIKKCIQQLEDAFYWFPNMNQARRDALTNMCFNLGFTRLNGFRNTLIALADEDYELAAKEALDSKWARQVGKRANDIAYMIKEGLYP